MLVDLGRPAEKNSELFDLMLFNTSTITNKSPLKIPLGKN